jgi:beta-glucosidase
MSAFPNGFVWGAASAAYQIEGAAAEGGRTPTIWDTFSHTPGKTFAGHTGDVACDAYHRWAEDLDLMAGAGIRNYRFGIGWTRIFPTPDETPNAAGLAYYDAVVDGCLARGITPWITLYHWDLPQYWEDRGGWRNPETARAFGRLAGLLARHFAGRVQNYFTLNEPACAAGLGYGTGAHAPGLILAPQQVFGCVCNLLLAHGCAASAIRAADPAAKVGIVTTGRLCSPAADTPADREAARQATFDYARDPDLWGWVYTHQLYLDPVVFGRFPAEMQGTPLAAMAAAVSPADLAVMHQVPDFIGLNIYSGGTACAGPDGWQTVEPQPGAPRNAMKWLIAPEVLTWGPLWIRERYGLPLYITENGLSCNDKVYLDGCVHDADRIDFLHRYLRALRTGIAMGSGVQGYFHWSLTDNYEWANGYEEHFGLIFIDYAAERRIPKDSLAWYGRTVRENGAGL